MKELLLVYWLRWMNISLRKDKTELRNKDASSTIEARLLELLVYVLQVSIEKPPIGYILSGQCPWSETSTNMPGMKAYSCSQ